jgi:hypothetical protein
VDIAGAITKKITREDILVGAPLPDDSVTTDAIADANVTNAKLATGAGEPGGAWTTWTPTMTNIGTGLNYAKYTKIGRTVYFKMKYTLASASITGSVSFTLPVQATDADGGLAPLNSTVVLFDSSVGTAGRFLGYLVFGSSTEAIISIMDTGTSPYVKRDILSSTKPFPWASSDVIYIIGSYEATS